MGASTFDASRKTNAASTSASAGGVRNPAWFPEPSVAPLPTGGEGSTAHEAIGAAHGADRRAAARRNYTPSSYALPLVRTVVFPRLILIDVTALGLRIRKLASNRLRHARQDPR